MARYQVLASLLALWIGFVNVDGLEDWTKDSCELTYTKMGCYLDLIGHQRALPNLLITDRDSKMSQFSGKYLDWLQWDKYKHSLACRCAAKAREGGYRLFGLQFWGECWAANEYQIEYKTATNCFGDAFQKCDESASTECVGATRVNFLYKLNEPESTEELQEDEEAAAAKILPGVDAMDEEIAENPFEAATGCDKPMDIAFAIDASGSVLMENYQRVKAFLKQLVAKFDISASGTHFAGLHYTSQVFIDFSFSNTTLYDVTNLQAAIDKMSYPAGATLTQLAIEYARLELFSSQHGARSDVAKVLMVMTDGRTYGGRETLIVPSYLIKLEGVKIVPIGVGSQTDTGELKIMNPSESLILESYETVETKSGNVLDKLVRMICNTTAPAS